MLVYCSKVHTRRKTQISENHFLIETNALVSDKCEYSKQNATTHAVHLNHISTNMQ